MGECLQRHANDSSPVTQIFDPVCRSPNTSIVVADLVLWVCRDMGDVCPRPLPDTKEYGCAEQIRLIA